EIDTQPVLVIHADEVKAAHGATVGQLDDQALFYMRTRGIPEAEARALLTMAFCRAALDSIDNPPLLDALTTMLVERLPVTLP
ncbi:MAG: SufD family Fe-S cluster assembly protein, partial [Dokdonella sp.]